MAYVERQRGGRQRVPMAERDEYIGWSPVCDLADVERGRTDLELVV